MIGVAGVVNVAGALDVFCPAIDSGLGLGLTCDSGALSPLTSISCTSIVMVS